LAIRAIVSGLEYSFGIISLDPAFVANLVRSYGSVVWLLPDADLLGDQPLVTTPQRTYNYLQMGELFTEIGSQTTTEIYDSLGPGSLLLLQNPDVPTFCLYGTGNPTEISFEYADGLNQQPTKINCENEGDGVVPLSSLRKCNSMNPLACKTFNLLSHSDLIKDQLFFAEVSAILNNSYVPGGCE